MCLSPIHHHLAELLFRFKPRVCLCSVLGLEYAIHDGPKRSRAMTLKSIVVKVIVPQTDPAQEASLKVLSELPLVVPGAGAV